MESETCERLDSRASVCDGWRVRSLEVRKVWAAAVAEAAVEMRERRVWRRVEGVVGGGAIGLVVVVVWG